MRLQIRPGKANYRAIWDVDGRRFCRSTGIPHSPADPADFEKNRQKALVRGNIMMRASRAAAVKPNMTIREYVENCIRAHKTSNRAQTWRLFLDYLGEHADDLVGDASREHQRRYMLARGEELGYTTLSEELHCLREIFEHAVDEGVLQFNPIDLTDIGSWYLRDGLSNLQLNALLLATQNVEWRTAIYLGFYCGATLLQTLLVEWGALTQEPQGRFYLNLPPANRNKGRLVEVHPGLLEHLKSLRRVNARMCPALSQLEGATAESRFSEIVVLAKLPDAITFGSLRRTHAAAIGVTLQAVAIRPALPQTNEEILAEFDRLVSKGECNAFYRQQPDKDQPWIFWDAVGDVARNWLFVVVSNPKKKVRFAKVTDDPGGWAVGGQIWGIDAETQAIAGELSEQLFKEHGAELT